MSRWVVSKLTNSSVVAKVRCSSSREDRIGKINQTLRKYNEAWLVPDTSPDRWDWVIALPSIRLGIKERANRCEE